MDFGNILLSLVSNFCIISHIFLSESIDHYTAYSIKSIVSNSFHNTFIISPVEFCFLLWGVYLCYIVRKAPSHFNESKYITWSIYNNVILGTFMLIIE